MPKHSRSESPSDERGTSKRARGSQDLVNGFASDDDIEMGSIPPAPLNEYLDENERLSLQYSAQRTPRFLFRAWRYGEDERTIDTADRIVPRALLGRKVPAFLFDLRRDTIEKHVHNNANGSPESSIFSTWTHSLHDALEHANKLEKEKEKSSLHSTHISIIDTKALPCHITILHTSFLEQMFDFEAPECDYQFLAYGVIKGEAYSAVPYQNFLPSHAKATSWWVCYTKKLVKDPDLEVRLAMDLGGLFGEAFKLPVAACALAMYTHNGDVRECKPREQYLVKTLLYHWDVPLEWRDDPTIVSGQAHLGDNNKAARCISLLSALTRRFYGRYYRMLVDRESSPSGTAELLGKPSGLKRINHRPSDKDYNPEDEEFSDHDIHMSGDEHFEEDVEIPRGEMDESTKILIQQSTKKTPRYLFRAWSTHSGGYKELNTTQAITPLEFFRHPERASRTIYHLDRTTLKSMVVDHLHGRTHMSTEFSSWAASLQVAFRFAKWRYNHHDSYISIIDTSALATKNIVVHVPSMVWLATDCATYHWEYLAHGVIVGRAHEAVPLSAFREAGMQLRSDFQALPRTFPCSNGRYEQITPAEIKVARQVADRYGQRFIVPMALGILCLKKRCGCYWRCRNIVELGVLIDGFEDCKIPHSWCGDGSIMLDVVHSSGYGEIKQMIQLLRALMHYWHGKGARGRSRSRSRERSASRPNMFVRAQTSTGVGNARSPRRGGSVSGGVDSRGQTGSRLEDICEEEENDM